MIATYQLRELATPVRCRDEPYLFPEEVHARDRLHRRVAAVAVCELQHLLPHVRMKEPPHARAICGGFQRL
jgi:hypothetical protein